MEALTALGVAGNVVQFVDFGIKSIKTVRELYKSLDGTLNSLAEIEKQAVEQTQYFMTIQTGPLSKQDPGLAKLVMACSTLSNELLDLLRSLKMDPGKKRIFESASKSMKAFRAQSRIKDLERGLDKIREAICTRLIVLLR